MKSLRVSKKARQDLQSIWNYTFDTWSEKQADKYLKEFMDEFVGITKFPERGRSYDEVASNFFGLKKNKHIIFYRITVTGEVEIMRILHESMDLPGRLKE